jgi:hypothetical protein
MVYRGPLGLAGLPDEERSEEFRMFAVNGGELRCWIHRDVLRVFASQGPFPDGSYLFAAGESGKLRLFFEKGFPLKEESRKEE